MARIELHNILATARPIGDPVMLCYDKDGNEIDCNSDNINSVRIVEDVVMGAPNVMWDVFYAHAHAAETEPDASDTE